MSTIYDEIYKRAEPYWQTRSNEIHLPMAYAYAKRLLAAYPEADASIVLPAILLHDVGYFNVPEETHYDGLAGAPIGWSADITRLHEQEGARLAGEMLRALNYPPEKIAAVQKIIDGHDSNPPPHSLEDAIVKDADKLWRFSATATRICRRWYKQTPQQFMDYVESKIPTWMLTEKGAELARQEMARTRALYASGQAQDDDA
jgi:hypothetical protein